VIKAFAQCSGDHKLPVSTEFPMDQDWVLGYMEYETADATGSRTGQSGPANNGSDGRKRICIEEWTEDAAYRPNVGHYCSFACAAAHLERVLRPRQFNGAGVPLDVEDEPAAVPSVPYRLQYAAAFAGEQQS